MSHEFDSGFFGGRQPAWHGLGTVIDKDTVKAKPALKLAGLDWPVEKVRLMALPTVDGEEMELDMPDHRATVRMDKLIPFGVVGADYELIQNDELLEFVAALCDTSDAIFHTAGALKEGRVVWALAKLPETIQILGMEEEKIQPYLMATNSHDGTRALTAAMTPVRVVCMNTLNFALSRAVRTWSLRHTSNVKDRILEAQEALGIAFKYMESFEKAAGKLVHQKMSKREFKEFLESLIPYDEEMARTVAKGEPNRAAKNVDEAREMVQSLYVNSPNLANVTGTAWAAVNAVAEYADFARKQRNVYDDNGEIDERAMGERRFVRVVWQNELKQRALKLVDPKLAHAKGENLEVLGGVS